jgi:hypothetical protein
MKTDEQFFNDRLTMCETDGWKDLMEELQELTDSLQDVESLSNMEDLFITKGQLATLRMVMTIEETARFTMEQSS